MSLTSHVEETERGNTLKREIKGRPDQRGLRPGNKKSGLFDIQKIISKSVTCTPVDTVRNLIFGVFDHLNGEQ